MQSSLCIETMVTALEIEILDCPNVFCSSDRFLFFFLLEAAVSHWVSFQSYLLISPDSSH